MFFIGLTQNKTVYPAVLYHVLLCPSSIQSMYINICLYVTSSSLMFTILFFLLFPLFPRLSQHSRAKSRTNQSRLPIPCLRGWETGGLHVSFFQDERSKRKIKVEMRTPRLWALKYTFSSPFFRPALNFQPTHSGLRT